MGPLLLSPDQLPAPGGGTYPKLLLRRLWVGTPSCQLSVPSNSRITSWLNVSHSSWLLLHLSQPLGTGVLSVFCRFSVSPGRHSFWVCVSLALIFPRLHY